MRSAIRRALLAPASAERERLGWRDLVPLALLTLLAVALHRHVVAQWWTHEDPAVLLFALGREPWELFFRPHLWQEFSAAGFFPMLPLSFRLDYAIGGLSPRFAYGHQLLALGSAGAVFYVYVRGFADRVVSTLASAALIAAPTTALIVRQGMARGYIEGLLFGCVALLAWRRRTLGASTVAAAFWIAASLCKEAWLLLPLVMAMDSVARREPRRAAAVRAVPVVVAGSLYLLWRTWMLGSGGGYGAFPPPEVAFELPGLFWDTINMRTAAAWRSVLATAIVLLAAASIARRGTRAALVAFFVAIAAIGPFLPAGGGVFYPRYAFGATAAIVGLAAAGASLLPRSAAWPLIALVLAANLDGGLAAGRAEDRQARLMGAVGRYLLDAPTDAPPLLAPTYGPHVDSIRALRRFLGHGEAPRAFLSEWVFILEENLPPRMAVVEENPVRIVVVPTAGRARRIRAALDRFRPAESLSVDVVRNGTLLRWQYGPPGAKRWNVLTWPSYEVRGVDASGWQRVQRTLTIRGTEGIDAGFRIRRIAPDGTWTVSPVFNERAARIVWARRPGAPG